MDCTEESLAQAFNKWRKGGKGHYAGKKRSKWAQDGLNAVIQGIKKEKARDHHHQYCLENPAWSALRFDKKVKEFFGVGIVVQGCAYGVRQTGKEYRFWMSAEAEHLFRRSLIPPNCKARSACEDCKAGRKHRQVACPQKGDKRPRENVPGQLQKATKNRIPPKLGAAIGMALRMGRARSEFLEQLALARLEGRVRGER